MEAGQGYNEAKPEGEQGLLPEEYIDTARGAMSRPVPCQVLVPVLVQPTLARSSDTKSLI